LISCWSCGGGVQSSAIAALIVSGKLPKPDLAVIVDTEREKETTWNYYLSVLRPELWKVGVMLQIVKKSEFATVDLYRNDDILIPAFTKNGKLPAFCSNEWKQRVVRRWLKKECHADSCELWLGISRDEMKRIRVPDIAWLKHRYPLIFDVPMRRSECYQVVKNLGWPDPPRSSCYMCPNQLQDEWNAMTPADQARAAIFESEIQKLDPELFLRNPRDEEDNNCYSGMCFV